MKTDEAKRLEEEMKDISKEVAENEKALLSIWGLNFILGHTMQNLPDNKYAD